ncbi:hypothetical protein QBC44DRAFT_132109 [Cladorrhinum sp. PSN332]|nr:hypothetical protein QBC44DRAFT_132109 [Cladorrhinum sp. PSN332]
MHMETRRLGYGKLPSIWSNLAVLFSSFLCNWFVLGFIKLGWFLLGVLGTGFYSGIWFVMKGCQSQQRSACLVVGGGGIAAYTIFYIFASNSVS